MSDPRSNPDDVEARLREALSQLERELHSAVRDELPGDPDGVFDELDRRTAQIDRLIREAAAVAGPAADARPGRAGWRQPLGDVVKTELDGVLTSLRFPLVCRTSFAAEGVSMVANEEPEKVRAAVRRTLTLGGAYAGPGGELEVATLDHDGRATLAVTAHRPDLADDLAEQADAAVHAGAEALELRSRSLSDFVEELGGSISVQVTRQGSMRVRLDFSFAAP